MSDARQQRTLPAPATIYLVDASIYIFQAHFSPYIEYTDQRGNELSALYGFIQFLLQFRRRTKATHMAVALDESLFCGFRHDLCPNYKSNRELPDDNLAMQLKACAEICQILGIAAFGSKVFEADDIVGTLAHRLRAETVHGSAISIVSKDKDLAQLLVNPKDCLWDYSGNRKRYWQDIVTDFGVTPAQIPDFLGLTGDAVDCIAGVPGVGPVKARALLQKYPSLEAIYANLDQIGMMPLRGAARLVSQLGEFRQAAELGKRLATIVCDVDEATEVFASARLSGVQLGTVDERDLQAFLQHYRFHGDDQSRILESATSLDMV